MASSTACRATSPPSCRAPGLKFGDRVAVMMPNVLQYPVTTAGILRAGMTVVNVNPLYTPRELEHQLNDSGAEAIVILENFATHAGEGAQEHAREARRPRQHGRPARLPEGRDRQPGGAQGEEDGAGLFAAAAPCSSRPRSRPARASRSTRARSRRTTSRSCNTPAAPPACRRARRCSIATSSPTCCRTMPGCSRRCRRSRRSIS